MTDISNVIVIDDEPVARERVVHLLARYADLKLVGEFENGQQALDFIAEQPADLMFVDVQMPLLDGMSMVKSMPKECRPFVIFVTAYDHFAVEAFDLFAIDYLLKPYSKERFDQALQKYLLVKNGNSHISQNEQLKGLWSLQSTETEKRPTANRLSIKLGNRTYFVAVSDIVYIESAGNYLEIFAEGRVHVIRETMLKIIQKLPDNFLRVHKSSIVNTNCIAELIAIGYGDYELKMNNGKVLRVSDSYKQLLLQSLET